MKMRNYLICVPILMASSAFGQLDFERAPINYSDSTPTDRVAQFAERLKDGRASLTWTNDHGYLQSLLKELNVPVSSQTLVFSKTSLQVSRISPRKPRAVYFNDDIYVGWVQRGDLIEISASDPALGGTFYTLPQQPNSAVRIKRETSRCLQCHGSTHTRRIPGHMVRSVYSDEWGQPVFRLGTHLNNHTTPYQNRFGGWYVTGTHGKQRHMANVFLEDPDTSEQLDRDAGANVTDLSTIFDTDPYLSRHSDIVALMVLQHQAHMHNILTAANHSGRLTARDAVIMNRALDRDETYQSESTVRRYESAAEKVVKGLLFVDEPQLIAPVVGTSSFTTEFAQRGPFDRVDRTLRTFNLQTRLFEYPCSFLIYSDAFQQLPTGVYVRVEQLLKNVLTGKNDSEEYAHLSPDVRSAIHSILSDTTKLKL